MVHNIFNCGHASPASWRCLAALYTSPSLPSWATPTQHPPHHFLPIPSHANPPHPILFYPTPLHPALTGPPWSSPRVWNALNTSQQIWFDGRYVADALHMFTLTPNFQPHWLVAHANRTLKVRSIQVTKSWQFTLNYTKGLDTEWFLAHCRGGGGTQSFVKLCHVILMVDYKQSTLKAASPAARK